MDEEHKRFKKDDPDLNDAMGYLNTVKEEFKDDITVYDQFLELMRDYKQGNSDAMTIVKAVSQLFKNKRYLIEGFEGFLPQTERVRDRQYERMEERGMNTLGRTQDVRIPERHAGRINEERANERIMHERMMHERMNNERSLDRSINERVNADRNIMHNERPPENIHDRGTYETRYFRGSRPDDAISQRRALGFIHKVKKRFTECDGNYHDFIRYLQQYQKIPGSADVVLGQLKTLLNGHEDLLAEFVDFLPQMRPRDSELFKEVEVKEKKGESHIIKTIHELLKKKELLDPFTKLLNMHNQGYISPNDFITLITPVLKGDEMLNAFKSFIGYVEADAPPHMLSNLRSYPRIFSYRILPEQYRNVHCDGQDSIARAVLNNYCLSCHDRDNVFFSSRKNQYEEILFQVEDERHESELMILRVGDLIMSLEYLMLALQDKKVEDEPEDVVFALDDIDIPGGIVQEVLASIYRDKAVDILEGILSQPSVSIPIVLKRLYSVHLKYRKHMKSQTRIWREITEKNHHRAIDARGALFKEERQDLSCKNALKEQFVLNMVDKDILLDIEGLYAAFVTGLVDNEAGDIIEWSIKTLRNDKFSFYATAPVACLIKFVLVLYERLLEMKTFFSSLETETLGNDIKISEMCKNSSGDSNQVSGIENIFELQNENLETNIKNNNVDFGSGKNIADKLGIVSELESLRRDKSQRNYQNLLDLIKDSLSGTLDTTTFEDRIRIITELQGYKLLNIEKYFGKLEKQAINVSLDDNSLSLIKLQSKNIGKCTAEIVVEDETLFFIERVENIFKITETEAEENDSKNQARDLIKLNFDGEFVPEKVSLERSKANDITDVFMDFNLECVVQKEKIKFVEGTWDLLMKRGKKRRTSDNKTDV